MMPNFKNLFRFVATLSALFFFPKISNATHNRAGEIHVRQVGGCNSLMVEAVIITWTRTSSTNADRDTLIICWGDGTCEAVPRSNGGGEGVPQPNDIKFNEYRAKHTYAGPATYKISMTDPNRIAGIINVNPPSSDNVQFHIETVYSFQDPQFGGCNTTPYLLQPPVDVACVGYPFKHNPNAYDVDGDSLSYKLIVPLADLGTQVPNYSYPYQIVPGFDNILQLDPVSGDLLWQSPQKAGEYNLAMIIVSWRNGQPIDTTIRDMQIRVEACKNNPPEVMAEDKICIVAGKIVDFEVTGDDPDSTDFVQLTALGGPLVSKFSPATFDVKIGYQIPIVTGRFHWQTSCEHISDQPYSVVFKAVDSLNKTAPKLADLHTTSIKVVGPAPEDLQAAAAAGEVEISWEKPYFCENAAENYFYGFSVWRREGSNPFPPDTCRNGLAGRGYTEQIFFTKEMSNGRYIFKDKKVERGRTYCYRVLAKFARISSGGYPYNLVESLPSEEVCVQLPRDLPLITNVDILKTGTTDGEIEIRWSKPVAGDLDTILNHGAYRYLVQRAPDFATTGLTDVPGGSISAPEFWLANDTFFVDKNLNTSAQAWTYQISFFVKSQPVPLGKTNTASSIFLTIAPSDNAMNLTWKEEVPWGNYRYDIFRKNAAGVFEQIGTTANKFYKDKNLLNGHEYCYFVRSFGTYSVGGVVNPIVNNSQQVCSVPKDMEPPCPPDLTISNLCTTGESEQPDPPFENDLSWSNPNQFCPETDDVLRYNIYYSVEKNTTLNLLETVDGAENTKFTHSLPDGLAGCYAVTAIDSFENESPKSTVVCVDNCPDYRLPNAFTPNGDGSNDHFTPFPGWRFIDEIDLQIFNRWGNLVFETTDPAINWDGKTTSGKAVATGTYFYVCKVFERRVDGVVLRPEVLKGYIEVFQNR